MNKAFFIKNNAFFILFLVLGILCSSVFGTAFGADLYVGTASVDISPEQPAILAGQFHARISKGVEYPVQLNIVAIETRDGEKTIDSAIFVGIDTVVVRGPLCLLCQEAVKKAIPDFDVDKILISATHTHSAPTTDDFGYPLQEGVQIPSEYIQWVADKLEIGARSAWESRQKAQFSFGLGHGVIAYNRRSVYADGSAVMYGNTNDPNFRSIEGVEDHDIGTIFFWDMNDKPLAMLVNVSCPSQETESNEYVSSDFWGPTRNQLREKYGENLVVVGLCGAGGDQSPHLRYRQAADDRMTRLRGLSRVEEIARRLVRGVDEAYEVAEKDKQQNVLLDHRYATLSVPMRKVTESEYNASKEAWEQLKNDPNNGQGPWNQRILKRYKDQKDNPEPTLKTPINVLRIGDVVICTNQFEFYTDFAIQMKARSKAVQTFVVQLTGGAKEPFPGNDAPQEDIIDWIYSSGGTYLPSERAVQGGGYGAIIQSNLVGPEGGQMIVEETLKLIDELWKD